MSRAGCVPLAEPSAALSSSPTLFRGTAPLWSPSPPRGASPPAAARVRADMGDTPWSAAVLAADVESGDDADDDQRGHHGGGDLRDAVGPVADDLTGVGVDEDPVALAGVQVRGDPDRQQDELEHQLGVVDVHGGHTLLVAPDVVPTVALDHVLHLLLRRGEALVRFDVVPQGLVAGE